MLQKKLLIALLTFTIAGGGYASITNAKSNNDEQSQSVTKAAYEDQNDNHDGEHDDEQKDNNDGGQSVTDDTYGDHNDGQSVTDETYGDQTNTNEDDQEINKLDSKTLSNLIESLTQLKGTSAKDAIENLLQKDLSLDDLISLFSDLLDINADQTQQVISNEQLADYVEAIHLKIINSITLKKQYGHYLKELAELYDKLGDIENSIDVSQEAIHSDVTDLNAYKKIGIALDKKGKKEIKTFVNGNKVDFDVSPIVKDGRTLVPFRAISESLNAQVTWNSQEQSITVSKDGVDIKLWIGQVNALVNGNEVKLEVPAEIVEGRTIVPVRFLSEAFNSTVKWEPVTQTVVIYN